MPAPPAPAPTASRKRAPDASGRPAERPPPAERRDRPVRHAAERLLERPRDTEEFGIIEAVEQHATWNHRPREDDGRWQRDRWDGDLVQVEEPVVLVRKRLGGVALRVDVSW